jgi:hypothetical protein
VPEGGIRTRQAEESASTEGIDRVLYARVGHTFDHFSCGGAVCVTKQPHNPWGLNRHVKRRAEHLVARLLVVRDGDGVRVDGFASAAANSGEPTESHESGEGLEARSATHDVILATAT